MSNRVILLKASPDLYHKLSQLEEGVVQQLKSAGIEKGFAHLLRLRASQINQCAYCVRLHTRDALDSGESNDRISVLPAWRETEYFNEKERAALALIEAVTQIAEGQLPDEIYQSAAAQLTSDEVAAVEWLGVVINAWNRIAIASRTVVKP